MSSMLYALGLRATRAKVLVLVVWLAILALLGAGAIFLSKGANAPITIPGTESQAAIDTLGRTFPEVSGTSGRIIVVAPEGSRVDSDPFKTEIEDAAVDLEKLDSVTGVSTPFSEVAASEISDDKRAALLTIQMQVSTGDVPAATTAGVQEAVTQLQDVLPEGTQVSYGGDAFSTAIPGFSAAESVGVIIAFFVLLFTLGSLVAAGMPLLIAMLGVGVSVAGIYFTTAFIDMTSTTPMLALMLGLAVGIDYTLFIVSRHQEQLRAGVEMRESIARATATSGSAVVFAGLTVIIALVGLSVAGIPFLTSLGVAAAAGVAIAVLIAVTLTPAVLAMAGMKILSRKQRRALQHGEDQGVSAGEAPATKPSKADRFFGGWVKGVTAKPLITVVTVLVALGIAAIPAFDLRLALPGAETLEADNPARVTYELTGEHFGEGANGPLLLTGSIISSTDPLGLMDDLADEIRQLPGVADVPFATPNQGADTGIIQVVPEEGPQSESTAALVNELRAHHDEWLEKYGVSLAVTGFTAVGIDVSRLLLEALVPFGVLVVGLSLILLAMVFRSVWVPIKATLGYVLSVGAAFGAVVAVFQWGWLASAFNVHHAGPVLSFMPILLMGVLFGLAMDYEVFLVSRIREEVVHGSDSSSAIKRGFVGSGRVVTAAAIIMFAVFAAFVPEGDPSIKVIALGLAVGVFVDAFIVRMTLVPAVLQLLGDRAWRMPRWLDKLLPAFDVEGEGLARELAHASWPADNPNARIASADLTLPQVGRVPELRVSAGEVLVLDPADARSAALAAVLSGRGVMKTGTLKVADLLLPERASSLRTRSAWATLDTLGEAIADAPELLVLDLRGAAAQPVRPAALEAFVVSNQAATLVVLGSRQQAEAVAPRGAVLLEPLARSAAATDSGAAEPALAGAAPASLATSEEGAR